MPRIVRVFSLTRTQRYGIALLGVVLAALIRLALDPVLKGDLPLFLFFFPVVVAAWVGGLGPGLLATALSLLLGDYLFLEPRGAIFHFTDALTVQRVAILGFMCTLFTVVLDRLRKAIKDHLDCLDRLSLLIESVADYAIITLDPQGNVACWNTGAARMAGYEKSEVLGKHISVFYPLQDAAIGKPLQDLEIASRDGRYVEEGWQIRKDGSRFWASGILVPLREASGELRGYAKVTRDMTDRRRADEEVRASHQFAQRIVEVSPSIIHIFDVGQNRTIFSNRDIGAVLGYDPLPDAPSPDALLSWIHPDDRAIFLDHLKKLTVLTDGATTECEYRLQSKSGDWRWFHSQYKVFARNEDGSVRETIGATTDITENKQREKNEQFMSALNEALMPLADAKLIMDVTVRMLGEYLQVDRCAYAEVDTNADAFTVLSEYTRGATASIAPDGLRMSEFGENEREILTDDQPYVLEDIEAVAPPGTDLARYRREAIRAAVCIPLKKQAAFVARLAVHQSTPRHWRSDEVKLIQDVANRGWESVERARALRRLKDSEDRHRAFIANSSEGIWRYEIDPPIPMTLPEDEQLDMLYRCSYIAECNDAMARMYGYDNASQILGKRLGDMLVHSEANVAHFLAFKRGGYRLNDFETEEIDRYGNTKYFLNNALGMEQYGSIVRAWGTQRDITDQKLAAEAVRASEERLHRITEATQDALWEIDLKANQVWWSEGAKALFGHSTGELQIRLEDWYNAIHPEDVARVHERFSRFMSSSDANWTDEYRFRRADGIYVEILDKGRKFPDADGNPTLIAGAMVDVTERKAAQTALEESELRFEKAFQASPDALIISRIADGVILEANDRFVEMSEYDRKDLIGKSTILRDLYMDPEDRRRAVAILEKEHRVRDFEFPMKPKSGKPRFISFSAEPLNIHGEQCWLTIGRDITQRKKAEAELERLLMKEKHGREEAEAASRLKDEFLATISHELRTPLTAILGWAHLLTGSAMTESETRHALQVIEQSARAQARLVEDILDTSRIITGRFQLDARPVEIEQVLQAAVDVIRPTAEAKKIDLHVVIDGEDITVFGDANRLQQVIWNLLSNAVKFTTEGGRVEVRLSRTGNQVEVSVSDNGIGIEPQFLPHVFDRFRQADSTSTRRFGGLGLGLAIVRHLVEMHGGRVSVSSPGKGLGATFTLQFPMTSFGPRPPGFIIARQPDEPQRPAITHRLDGVRTLVVDDDPDTLDLIRFILDDSGADVVTASSATEALQAMDRCAPNVLVSDLAMPEQNGFELIAEVRSRPPERGGDVPAVALSAYARAEDDASAKAAGFQLHLSKPVDPEALIAVVADLAGKSQAK